jgi:Uma2 family endonuclease
MVTISSDLPPRVFGNNDLWFAPKSKVTYVPDIPRHRWTPISAFSEAEMEITSIPFVKNSRVLKNRDREDAIEGKP